MILFEIYFSDGSICTLEALNPIIAAIKAQMTKIQQGHPFYLKIDSIQNQETGEMYKLTQKITKIGTEK